MPGNGYSQAGFGNSLICGILPPKKGGLQAVKTRFSEDDRLQMNTLRCSALMPRPMPIPPTQCRTADNAKTMALIGQALAEEIPEMEKR